MKIIICTTPIRPIATDYPPFGSMAIIQSLRSAGYSPFFFDIDGLRPSFPSVLERFRKEAPNVIGVSAVVSTAYGYVKELCTALKQILPDTTIVLGGNLAASAELLHRLCSVDICVVGEGEKIVVNLVNHLAEHGGGKVDSSELQKIRGITYLDAKGNMRFTGFETAIPGDELFNPDWTILEQFSKIENFISDPFTRLDFAQDPRSVQPHRRGKKMGTVLFTKGCVARCTFCHRWDKGFRQMRPEHVIERIKHLIDHYNVGFIQFGDENFGSDSKATDELIRLLAPLDILWQVAGVRARTINFDLLKRMRDAGCVSLYYGFETGSPEILQAMEKNLSLSHNFIAARSTYDAGLFTIYQLVFGMPGESPKTISRTIEMVKSSTEFLPEPPYTYISTNYIQALPGTPVYEYARTKRLIGPTLHDEEQYLLAISDINAADDTKFLNFTDYPYLVVRTWRLQLLYEVTVHWARSGIKRGQAPSLPEGGGDFRRYEKGGYFNRHDIALNPLLLRLFYPVRWLPIWAWTLASEFRRSPYRVFVARVWELLTWPFRTKQHFADYRSLRRVMNDLAAAPQTQSEESMLPLRLGR